MSISSENVESRLQQLEDIEAIRALKADYCFSIDQSRFDHLVELFVDDAVWQMAGVGRFEGKAAIEEFFRGVPDILRFWLHMVMNPLITVEGDEARGRWYLLEPNTLKDGRAAWGAGRYEERYRRTSAGGVSRRWKCCRSFGVRMRTVGSRLRMSSTEEATKPGRPVHGACSY